MLSKRIIACLDVRDGQVVKGINFEGLRSAGDPAELARRYNREGIDELVILDITATLERRRALADTIRSVARELFIPLAVGGGIRTEDDAAAAVDAGADKVSLNTAALKNPELITTLANRYGSQAVVVAIDAKRDGDRFAVYVRSGQSETNRDAVEWAREAESRGAGEILLTSIDRDGTKIGFDCELTAAVSHARLDSGDRVGRRRRTRRFRGRLHQGARRRRARRVDLSLRRNQRRRAQTASPRTMASPFDFSHEGTKARSALTDPMCLRDLRVFVVSSAMLIPAIDLKDGAVVQLIQGEKLAIRDEDIEKWVKRFERFPKVQIIDLDAAMGAATTSSIVRHIAPRLTCRVGGGIRTVARAREILAAGAQQIIAGSSLFKNGQPDSRLREALADAVGAGSGDRRRRQPRRQGRDPRLEDPAPGHGHRGRPGARAVTAVSFSIPTSMPKAS